MLIANNWKEYQLLDSGDGEKLEKWGDITLSRPDPLAIWPKNLNISDWQNSDAFYKRNDKGGGKWSFKKNIPDKWTIKYKELIFIIKPTPFKHTGIFPEQSSNWDAFSEIISKHKDREINILNLFAYTGGATIACTKIGAKVCHVDSSKGIIGWAKENADKNNLGDKIRWIVDDAIKFVDRELKRGVRYDAIIMDPPSYGRGSKGEIWKLDDCLWPLIQKTKKLLSKEPLFFHINSYSTGMSPTTIGNILTSAFSDLGGQIKTDELGLKEKNGERILPQGVFGRWEN